MLSSPDLSFSRTLPLNVFNQLGELLEQMAQAVGNDTLILTEAVLVRIRIPAEWQGQKFTLLVSERFSALLVGKKEEVGKGEEFTSVNARLTFSAEAIASFIAKLQDLFGCDSSTHQNIERYCQILAPNDATLQGQFTLLLLEYLLLYPNQEGTALPSSNYPDIYTDQSVEDALKKRISQERLLHQITTQIRKSLDLPIIMATAVTQVSEFLNLDRLVIYKFDGLKVKSQPFDYAQGKELGVRSQESSSLALKSQLPVQNYEQYGGCVVHEARARDTIPSVLNYREETCFIRTSQCWEKYRQGFTLVVDDVEKTYALEECLLNFFRESQIRAKLAAPIIFEDNLWGLLIAHQCNAPRQWTESEINLLNAIAEQLAIAIHQAELMRTLRDATQTLTQDKHTLEQQVIERTMALREALLAAEAASRLRNEFLATISHELLTPLTYVIGMSSTLLRWPLGELSQRQRDYLQTIHDSGEHLLGMINDILDLSQIEAGKTVLNITEFSLVRIAENTVESLLGKAKTEQINLKLDVQIDPRRDRFNADVPRVEQILTNLLTNAIKFTPEDGSVTLRLWVEDDTAIFQVEDTGIGIPEHQLPLLFEKFHQLDTPYRRRYAGTGLGLALTKQLVELHRGRIEVESTVGIGSIFTVWIPAQLMRD
ncbi:GAF domain-containing sensor histidine kinase [Calothrix sp. PCC 7507]|uniref:GAF domain-containing sensor histidine kinase n=1 Tax=Calothrix sp. PCC 7507 TaxID=99598 RepID=UPI00029EED33|nr:GAF domain-containing sensor histidine kinase [Calothrix sp. PCC 7507]AFY33535.1 GAF sensor signal transduction histidine kinase [Calothrix sp. PCC 7507]